MIMKKNTYYMDLAIEQALIAKTLGEIPVGCVIVKDDEVVAVGHNTRETQKNALSHAEINAISSACSALSSWRLNDCVLYVTLEPCPMCMGAILNARIKRLVFGAYDSKAGCCGSIIDLNQIGYPHHIDIFGGISESKCQVLLEDFFKELR